MDAETMMGRLSPLLARLLVFLRPRALVHLPTRTLVVLLAPAIAVGGCAAGAGDVPRAQTTPPLSSAFGTFDIRQGGRHQSYQYNSENNTVFCTTDAGWASLWIRLGEQPASNGENGPHIDIDVCSHSGGGDFGPKDPADVSCSAAKTFDIFWHAADGSVYANKQSSPGCLLSVNENGPRLVGAFECQGLVRDGETGTVDITGGAFECVAR